MRYTVFEIFKGTRRIALYSSDDKMDCCRYADDMRRQYRRKYGDDFFVIIDCSVRSEEDLENERKIKDFWDSLTEEQKHETIEVDGKRFVKAIYEARQGKA